MKILTLLLLMITFSAWGLTEKKSSVVATHTWIEDANELLGEDMQRKFRAKDRLKDLDYLEDMLIKEVKSGKNKGLALNVIHELKLVGLLPQLMELTLTTKETIYLRTINHLSHKEDLKAILPIYRLLLKNNINKDVGFSYLSFADYYNLKISMNDLNKIWSLDNDEVKNQLSEYLINKRELYSTKEYSELVNRSLKDKNLVLRASILNTMRGLTDSEAEKYAVNYHICRLEKDPKMNLNCKLMQKFSVNLDK